MSEPKIVGDISVALVVLMLVALGARLAGLTAPAVSYIITAFTMGFSLCRLIIKHAGRSAAKA